MDGSGSVDEATLRLSEEEEARPLPRERPFTIGRDAGNDLTLDHPDVSRQHADISYVDGSYRVTDLQSANGTFIERGSELLRVGEATPLEPADTLRVGPYRLLFEGGGTARLDPQHAQPWAQGISAPTVMAGFAHFFAGFLMWALVPVLASTIGAEFDFSRNVTQLLVGVAIAGGVVARVIFGLWTDARGPFAPGTVALAAGVVPLTGLWLFGDTQIVLWVCVFLLGLGLVGLPISIPMASQRTAPDQRGVALGIVGAGSLGLVAAAVGGTPLEKSLGWQAVFGLAIIPTVIATAIFAWGSRGSWTSPPAGAALRLAKSSQLWTVGIIYGVTFGVFTALYGFLPSILTEDANLGYDLSLDSAGLVVAGGAFFGAFARPVGGQLADRFGPLAVLPWVALAGAIALIIVGAVGVIVAIVMLIVVMTIFEVGTGAGFKLAAQRFGSAFGAGAGMVGALGALLAFGAVQLLTILITETKEPVVAFGVLAAVPMALFVWMFIDARLEPEKARPVALPATAHLQRLDLYGKPIEGIEIGEGLTIGRATDNWLLLASDDLVSRHHAAIEVAEGRTAIRDLKSTNGTMLWRDDSWRPVAEEELRDGDVIVIGSNIFRFAASRG